MQLFIHYLPSSSQSQSYPKFSSKQPEWIEACTRSEEPRDTKAHCPLYFQPGSSHSNSQESSLLIYKGFFSQDIKLCLQDTFQVYHFYCTYKQSKPPSSVDGTTAPFPLFPGSQNHPLGAEIKAWASVVHNPPIVFHGT